MAKTLDDLQNLLAHHGYTCERLVDVIVATTVPTEVYKNPEGANNLQILLTIDRPNNCVAVEVLRAFELRDTAHKEATLACLLTVTGRTALLRPSIEQEGHVRLRIDCTLGKNGARVGDVLQAVALLPTFVDAVYPQVTSAMQSGTFDVNKVAHLNLSRLGCSGSGRTTRKRRTKRAEAGENTDDAETADREIGQAIGSVVRAAALSGKPGAHPNRLKVLFEFQKYLEERNRGAGDQN